MTRTVDVDGTEQEVTGLPWEVGINSNRGEWSFRCEGTDENGGFRCENPATETRTRCLVEEEAQAFCQAPCDTFCTENAYTTVNNADVYAMGSTVSSCESAAADFDEDFASTMAKATALFAGARDTLSAKGPLATAVCDRARPRYNPYRP